MGTALALAIQVLEVLPTLITAGADALGFIDSTTSALKAMQAEDRDPSDAEWADLNAQIATLRARLDGTAAPAPTTPNAAA
jgi:hypothetical protein